MPSDDNQVCLTQAERETLRIRYREERDKRLRADGNHQYVEPTGRFAHFVEDPYVPRVERAPVFSEVTVAFIGGGFAGLCTGARMKQAGIEDFHIIEGGGDFGGVWYWNRYPGAMCDTAAMVYLPLIEEVGTRPTMKYVLAPEIWRHALRIAEAFGLRGKALFSTNVTLLEWDDADSRWVIHTDRGDRIRARVDAIVRDPATAEKLKPWYRQLCKRPCFHDEYLQSFNRPNVHLVDTDGKGVERIDATGVWANGRHFALDGLVFASGFEFATDFTRRCGFETRGRDGETLSAHWKGGMRSLHGIHAHGFPNLFIVSLSQGGGLISNITQNLVEAGTTIAKVVRHALDAGREHVEATPAAEGSWVDLIESAPDTFLGNPECTPGYYNNEGQEMGRRERLNVGRHPLGPVAYFQYIDEWRKSGRFEGLEFRRASEAAKVAG